MQEDETFVEYSNKICFIVNKIRLLEDFKDDRIVEKIHVKISERFESKISSLEELKDLYFISVEELMSGLQAKEEGRPFRQNEDNVIEGAFYAKNRKEKGDYSLCKYCIRKIHLERFCWCRLDAICENCKQTGHVTKV